MSTKHSRAVNRSGPPDLPASGVLFVGIVAVSVSAILIRLAQGEAPSLFIAAGRLALASLILLPPCLAWRRDELRQITMRQWGLALLSGLVLAAHFASWITSLEHTTVASSTVLVSTSPLWVGAVSPLLLKEPLSQRLKAGIGLALLGSMLIWLVDSGQGLVGGSQPALGNGLALLGAWAAAIYLLIGRQLRAQFSLLTYTTVVYTIAAVTLLLINGVRDIPLLGYPWQTYLLVVLMALIPQLLGHQAFNWALGHLSASFVSVTMVSEPIGAGVLAWLLFAEVPGAGMLVGGTLILIGIVLAGRRQLS